MLKGSAETKETYSMWRQMAVEQEKYLERVKKRKNVELSEKDDHKIDQVVPEEQRHSEEE